jgi:radical SAM protein with 4Fe4S-binding SPASM domain
MGMGEPLANPQIVDMYKYARDLNIAERLELTTNGALLTKEKSLALVDSGITRIIVSLQGINAESYKKTVGVSVDFDKFYDNLSFLFANRKNCKIHLKAVDTALGDNEEEKFFEMFSPIADTINIDRTMPLFANVDYDSDIKSRASSNIQGVGNKIKTCPIVFYMMFVMPDGRVLACCDYDGPIIGNVFETPLNQIWGGAKHKALMKSLLRDKTMPSYCKTCTQKESQTMPEDDIENYREKIYDRL